MPKPRSPRTSSSPDTLADAATRAGLGAVQLSAVRDWLAEQLIGDEFAKLGQAGQDDARVPLRRVFVDLPIGGNADEARKGKRRTFLSALLELQPQPLRPGAHLRGDGALPLARRLDPLAPALPFAREEQRAGFVLVGGPGQGKSTLVQLACQLHRAALLQPRAKRLSAAAQGALAPFLERGKKVQSLQLPTRPMLPLRVVLPDAALWLAQGQGVDLLRFIEQAERARRARLRAESLRALAGAMPVLLIFDGLDEVGAAIDRERVLAAMARLITELGDAGAEGLVVATTRPQGYTDELSQLGLPLDIRTLSPLHRGEALQYARRLIDARVQSVEQRKKLLDRMQESADEAGASQLLRTPLQVSILCALVQRGRAPKERWRLFEAYYQIIYQREIERETWASGLLQQWRSFIDALHARVALLLTIEGEESAGGRMSRERLAAVGAEILRADGLEEPRREALLRETLDAVERRLVFLVEPEPGQVGFEIRPLQEYMAARAITDGEAAQVRERLRLVARSPQLRNMLLFCASRVFVERNESLRESFAEVLCAELDADPIASLTRAGALLALEVLEEGSVQTIPACARQLMARALALLELPAGEEHPRLYRVADADTEPALLVALERQLGASHPLAAWLCMMQGCAQGSERALALAAQRWHALADPLQLLRLCLGHGVFPERFWLDRLRDDPARLPPVDVLRVGARTLWLHVDGTWLAPLADFIEARQRHLHPYRASHIGENAARLDGLHIPDVSEVPASWAPWMELLRFEREPSALRLATCLYAIATHTPQQRWSGFDAYASWPVAAALASAADAAALQAIADALLRGELGDAEQWRAAQSKWSARPSSAADFDALLGAAEAVPWDLAALEAGAPLWASMGALAELAHNPSGPVAHLAAGALLLWSRTHNPVLKRALTWVVTSLLPALPPEPPFDPATLLMLLSLEPRSAESLVPLPPCLRDDAWPIVLDAISGAGSRFWFHRAGLDDLMQLFASQERFAPLVCSVEWSVWTSALGANPLTFTPPEGLLKALRAYRFGNTAERSSAAILRVRWEPLSPQDLDSLVAQALGDTEPTWNAAQRFAAAALQGVQRPEVARNLLSRAYIQLGPGHPEAIALLVALRTSLRSCRSGLTDGALWTRHGLKPPLPLVPVRHHPPSEIPETPVVIESIRIEDLRGLRQLDLQLPPPPSGVGQWLVLLGANGAGKTTLLRGLVLALRDLSNPGIWPSGLLATPWVRVQGAAEARVQVKLAGLPERLTRVQKNGTERFVQEPPHTTPRVVPLFAYGCRRGSALARGDNTDKLKDDDGPEVATLFNEDAVLVHAESWIIALEGDALKKVERSRRVYESLRGALRQLLELADVWVQDKRLWVRERSGRSLPFAALSDGYLTSAGWFLDLVARWLALAERAGVTIEEDILKQMTGLVLIDEIDLHIHPRWQVDMIRRTRRLLSRMSFVVSTHNPLALVGARPEEIVVLDLDDDGEVRARQRTERPMLLTGGQLYSHYFGMRDIYPHEIGRKLEEYTLLAGDPHRDDAAEAKLVQLMRDLREEGIQPVMAPLPRVPRSPGGDGPGEAGEGRR